MSSASVVFTPSGKRGSFPLGTPVLEAARSLGVDLDSVCGGRGICARCQVIHTTGEFPKHGLVSAASHLSPFNATEEKLVRKTTRLKSGRRLGCTAQILGDCVIDVPPESQIHRQVVRKEAEIREIKIDPVVRLYYVEVEPPKMEDPTSDLRRLLKALETEWELQKIKVPHSILEMLQPTLREGKWKVTVAVDHDGIMRWIWSDFREHLYGIAVDIVGNMYVTGFFGSSINFGGGTLTASGKYDMFIVSLTSAGKHRWSRFHGSTTSLVRGRAIETDGNGNTYVAGAFTKTVDFGGGPLTSAGSGDIVLLKLSP